MKIRIHGNSIRFRLTRSEVGGLCRTGEVGENTHFDGAVFSYVVQFSENLEQLSADFNRNTITLRVPKHMAKDWDSNEKIGFQNKMVMANGQELTLLLEKDFVCLDNTTEDQSDQYANPKG